MTHWRTLVDDSEWVHHCDIEGKSPITLEIERVETKEAYNPGTNEKGMLRAVYFKGAKKPLGINITNGYIIQALHGEHIEHINGIFDNIPEKSFFQAEIVTKRCTKRSRKSNVRSHNVIFNSFSAAKAARPARASRR